MAFEGTTWDVEEVILTPSPSLPRPPCGSVQLLLLGWEGKGFALTMFFFCTCCFCLATLSTPTPPPRHTRLHYPPPPSLLPLSLLSRLSPSAATPSVWKEIGP